MKLTLQIVAGLAMAMLLAWTFLLPGVVSVSARLEGRSAPGRVDDIAVEFWTPKPSKVVVFAKCRGADSNPVRVAVDMRTSRGTHLEAGALARPSAVSDSELLTTWRAAAMCEPGACAIGLRCGDGNGTREHSWLLEVRADYRVSRNPFGSSKVRPPTLNLDQRSDPG